MLMGKRNSQIAVGNTTQNQLVWEKEATKREPAVNVEMRMPEVPSSFTQKSVIEQKKLELLKSLP